MCLFTESLQFVLILSMFMYYDAYRKAKEAFQNKFFHDFGSLSKYKTCLSGNSWNEGAADMICRP